MGILHEFSIGDGSSLRLHGDTLTRPDLFFEQAEPILREAAPEVLDDVIPNLENLEGKWHPLGFMAYRLGNIAAFGTLRLHIWPADLRRESPRGPKIHDHAWHLSSLVMQGVYTDELYDVAEVPDPVYSEEERQQRGLLRVFSPRFRHTSAALETDGSCAIATPTENRAFDAGSTHAIPVGVFHITDIPKDQLVTTLLIESPTYNTHTRILMDTPMDPLTDPRHDMLIEDAIYAKEQVLKTGLYA
jgi:hypothetical protein